MQKVSVVIPIYNGEPYLHKCLDSVCAQTLEEIEIICVDDGSTDGSWKILKEYREKDPRFRLIHQENLHVSAARNNGLSEAQGKYVIFWDCDDFFEPQALELLYRRAEETEAEICVCNNDVFFPGSEKIYPSTFLNVKKIPKEATFNRLTNPEHILSFTNAATWNKLFLRSFLMENDIAFPDFQYGEDRTVTYLALCLASRVTTVNQVLIHYRWNYPKTTRDHREDFYSLEFAVDQLIQRGIAPMEDLEKKLVQRFIEGLYDTENESAFNEMLRYLREGDNSVGLLEKYSIGERMPGYYNGSSDNEFVKRLLHDKPGDLLAFFMNDDWKKRRVLSADLRKLRAELKATKANLKATQKKLDGLQKSRSYRLGRALLFIPRKIRDLFRRAA